MTNEGERARVIATLSPARASSTRSTLDLLTLRWPFSQVQLLSAEEFLKRAEERRIVMLADRVLDLSGLEELHRTGVLIPFYRVRLDNGDPEQAIDLSDSRTLKLVPGTITNEAFRGAHDGRVTDPAAEPYEPWPTEQRRMLWPSNDWAFVYSHHQLLGLRRARTIVGMLHPRHHKDHRTTWHLADEDVPEEQALTNCASWRGLAVVLSALDTTYWPQIMHTVHFSFEEWREHRLAFDPAATLDWLGVTVEEAKDAADQLRFNASFADVFGDLYDIVRRAKPQSWYTMRGPALTAIDDLVAAEVLHQTAEEITGPPPPQPLPPPLSQQWLGQRPHSLDAALNDMQLSPHPALVVAVEGKTELTVLPWVFGLLGIRDDPAFIRIESFGGTKKDLSLMARLAAAPLLGADRGEFVELDRPVTRFLVLTDAENKYRTASDRREQRLLLLDSITEGIPDDLRADLYQDRFLARTVEIRTWGKYPFEFAHFSDEQLADAILSQTTRHHPKGEAGLIAAIKAQRASPAPDIEKAWKQSGVSKTKLVDGYWPMLERRIKTAITKENHGPPIMAAALRAYELASLSYGRSYALRRRRFHAPKRGT